MLQGVKVGVDGDDVLVLAASVLSFAVVGGGVVGRASVDGSTGPGGCFAHDATPLVMPKDPCWHSQALLAPPDSSKNCIFDGLP